MNDIFADPALPKAFYHPTRKRDVDHYIQTATLSPDRQYHDNQELDESYLDSEFIKEGHTYKKRLPTTMDLEKNGISGDTSSKFDESWPASERPSTVSIPELNESQYTMDILHQKNFEMKEKHKPGQEYTFQYPERDISSKQISEDKKYSTVESSTLAKYIDRFRYGQPMSREEREHQLHKNTSDDFWWLNKTTPSDTSTPKDDSVGSKTKRRTPKDENKENRKTHMSLGEYMKSCQGTILDENLRSLQEKADRLLEKTGGSLNSSEPIVSTDGLGSTVGSSSGTPRTVDEPSYRPEFIKKKDSQYCKYSNPDEDILIQWRRKRKIELMKTNDPILGRTSKAADHELESKLATFRKRLDATLKGVNEIPLTDQHLAQTSKLKERLMNEQQSASNLHSNHGIFTPAPQIHMNTNCQSSTLSDYRTDNNTHPVHSVTATNHHHSPIASPNLPRKSNNAQLNEQMMQPHMHLSCDIIPCPVIHTHNYHTENKSECDHNCLHETQQKSRSLKKAHSENHNLNNSSSRSRSKRHENYDQRGCVEDHLPTSYDDSDSSFERMKIKHMNMLKQEESLKHHDLKNSGRRLKVKKQVKTNAEHCEIYKTKSQNQDEIASKMLSERKSNNHSKSKHEGLKESEVTKVMTESCSDDVNQRRSSEKRQIRNPNSKQSVSENWDSLTDVTQLDPSKSSIRDTSKHRDSSVLSIRDTSKHRDSSKDRIIVQDEKDEKSKSLYDKVKEDDNESQHQDLFHVGVGQPEAEQDYNKENVKKSKKENKPKLSETVPVPTRSLPNSRSSKIPPPKQSVDEPEFQMFKVRGDRRSSRRSYKSATQPLHSSPMPSINSAIGQVVGDHLFVSSVSFASSVDSFQPSHINVTNTTVHEQPEPEVQEECQDNVNLDEELLSDGEEFLDDEILCDLRKRRNKFLQQLLEIDAILEDKNTEH